MSKKILYLISATAVVVLLAWALGTRTQVPAQASSIGSAGGESEPPSRAVDKDAPAPLPVYGKWDNYTQADGLPSNKVFSVAVDAETVWFGTENGLARYRGGTWKSYGTEDGLPHQAVLSVDVSPQTGDVWIGTMGGLARLSAGRIDVFTQISSGLSNDFVNEVQCDPDESVVWAATAMGLSRLDVATGTWEVYTQENTPMHEPWTYSVAIDRSLVYLGAWGAGILEYSKAQKRWREYRDPDREMDIDLLPNDGPVHDVTAGVEFDSGILWQASYTGLGRYDGRMWASFYKEDSGLASNFVNFIKARGKLLWACTDSGLSVTDGEKWITYRAQTGRGMVADFLEKAKKIKSTRFSSSFPHNFILGADLQGDDVWLATQKGVSRGIATSKW